MTLVLSFLSPQHVVQVSDRRVTWLDGPNAGQIADDDQNKAVLVLNRFAISYSGLATIDGIRTDDWIAKLSSGVRPCSPQRLVTSLRDSATAAFRTRHGDPRFKRHAFVLAGWVRHAPEAPLAPIVIAVSNALDETWGWREQAESEFKVSQAALADGAPFSLTETGANLSPSDKLSLQRVLMSCVTRDLPPMEISRLLADAIRRVASKNATVGENILAVSLPAEATKKPPAMFVSGELAMRPDEIGVLNFRAAGDPLWHAPHLVGGDMEFMHVSVRAEPTDLGPEVPAWMRGPMILSRRIHSNTNGIVPDITLDLVSSGWGLFAEASQAVCETSPSPCVVIVFLQPPPLEVISADARYLVLIGEPSEANLDSDGSWIEQLTHWLVDAGLDPIKFRSFVEDLPGGATRGEVVYKLREFFRGGNQA